METRGVKGLHDEDSDSEYDYSALYEEDEIDEQRTEQETKGWNLFREIPVKQESGSMATMGWVDTSVKLLKLTAYISVFLVVLGSATISKGTILFMTSQLKKDRVVQHCNRLLALDQQFITRLSLDERVAWLWALLTAVAAPELGLFLRSVRIAFFKTAPKPTKCQFFVAFIVDSLHTIGIALLLLFVLPDLDVLKGAMLMNAMCIVPLVMNTLTRDTVDPNYFSKLVIDVLAISAQVTSFVLWPLLSGNPSLWATPFAAVFISLGWWENFINYDEKTSSTFKIVLTDMRLALKKCRYYTQQFLTLWKILLFMVFIMLSLEAQGDDGLAFFYKVGDAFTERSYVVHEVIMVVQDAFEGIVDYTLTGGSFEMTTVWSAPLWVAAIQMGSCYICFVAAKFACKILIQEFSFTFALSLVGPLTINLLIVFCGLRNGNPCAFHGIIPDYLFFEIPPVYFLGEYISRQMAWVWLLWLSSQCWITIHAWQPKCERLAATDKLFTRPWYSGAMVDISLLFTRTKDDAIDLTVDDLKEMRGSESGSFAPSSEMAANDVRPSDIVTRIYVCATMWHETREEMIEFLKSIFRMDEDQSARRVAQKYLGIVDPDYYELEIHIFMDDAFEVSDHSMEDSQVNRFVKCLVDTIDDAASEVHLTNVRLRPPKKYPTPYGGRLVWTLPGKSKMICHLKDKSKIRHRKRWSQVMYMYYFLGHRLMDLPITVERKEVLAENTFLLALDGDIDFKPSAVTLLIDLMKKDKNLGAACGRIHPVGSGFMAWYQMFEYAIGHWLQKATEHMIGCVLCSPGCFSLFRGKALMDDNVMKKYTLTSNEARHYVQYDQGEDRWLCTLLLQRGYRVEYSAASDAYTHCPEAFDEFFNQRRRWVPSTMANILDLLADAKRTVKVNDNISTMYIVYQIMLMVGTILGPGTIFLMLIGAMNSITGISNYNAMLYNLIPVALFLIVCLTCDSKIQLLLANLITCFYALLMAMVIVGLILQIVEDGWLAPASIFTVITFSIFFITAALHPQEFHCLPYLIIYYITIPSMYMLLIIYSLCNLNNVSWGTREVAQKKTLKEMEQEKQQEEEAKKKMDNQSLRRWLGVGEETSGSLEFSVAGLFRCMCCTNPKDHKEDLHLLKIAHSLEKLEKRLDSLGAIEENIDTAGVGPSGPRRVSTVRRVSVRRDTLTALPEYAESEHSDDTDVPREERDDLINPYWIEDPNLHKGEVDFLMTAETEFWKDLIDTYLRPIDENKEELDRIKAELKNLRNMMVFSFVMLNTLFVLVIFMLQLNQEQLHIRWPFGQDVFISYDDEQNLITIEREYLMLEPIGTLFLVFFGLVMMIQFIAMLFHRMGTLTHLLSTVHLNWPCMRRVEETSDFALIEKNAIQIAKDLQKLNDDDLLAKEKETSKVSRRKTIQNLEKARESKRNVINLDANFKRRLTILQNGNNSSSNILSRMPSLGATEATRRATLRAIQTRRESYNNRPSHSTIYESREMNSLTGRKSGAMFAPTGYEPALDSDDEVSMSPKPRRSTVRFRETYT